MILGGKYSFNVKSTYIHTVYKQYIHKYISEIETPWERGEMRNTKVGVPTVVQQDQQHLWSTGTWVWSIARHSRLGIWHCYSCSIGIWSLAWELICHRVTKSEKKKKYKNLKRLLRGVIIKEVKGHWNRQLGRGNRGESPEIDSHIVVN